LYGRGSLSCFDALLRSNNLERIVTTKAKNNIPLTSPRELFMTYYFTFNPSIAMALTIGVKRNDLDVLVSSGINQYGWEEIPNGSVLVVDRVKEDIHLLKIE
jgi:hypothetical protein